jgi:hypothetical protein
MTALLSRRRLDMSAAQSVDDLAQVKQIPESAQIVVAIADIVRGLSVGPLGALIGPLSWNERPAAVRQDHEDEKDAAPSDAAERGQQLAFENVTLAVIVTESGRSRRWVVCGCFLRHHQPRMCCYGSLSIIGTRAWRASVIDHDRWYDSSTSAHQPISDPRPSPT